MYEKKGGRWMTLRLSRIAWRLSTAMHIDFKLGHLYQHAG
jgi:hypothetical protein